jgi:hypothetical protein
VLNPARLALASRSLAGCDCHVCQRAAALDAMRHAAIARDSTPTVPAVAYPRAGRLSRPLAGSIWLALGGSAWLALGGAALWLMARLS